jgi:RNA recognition motif-containing protein
VYGNVVRVKIMFKNRSTALIQLENLLQCRAAQQNLNGVVLHGKPIQVEISKGGAIPPNVQGNEQMLTRVSVFVSTIFFIFARILLTKR